MVSCLEVYILPLFSSGLQGRIVFFFFYRDVYDQCCCFSVLVADVMSALLYICHKMGAEIETKLLTLEYCLCAGITEVPFAH